MSHWFLVAKIYFRFQKNWLSLDFIPDFFQKCHFFEKFQIFEKCPIPTKKKNLFFRSILLTWSKMTIFGSWREVESRKVLCWYSCQDHRINKQVIDITEKVQPSNLILFYMNKIKRIHNMKWTFTQNSNLLVIARVPMTLSCSKIGRRSFANALAGQFYRF